MHVALLAAIDPSPLARDGPAPALGHLESVVEILDRHPHAPVALHVAAHILEQVGELRPDLAERLPALDVEWVRTGWGRPDPTVVPDRVMTLAVEKETEALERLGVTPGPLWVRDRWDARLPLVLTDAGVTALLLDASLVPEARAGVAVYLDRILPAIPVVEAPITVPAAGDDRLAVWHVAADRLDSTIEQVAAAPTFDLTTPGRFLSSHRVSGRLRLPTGDHSVPGIGQELAIRKLIRLATRLPERLPPPAIVELLRACHAPALAAGSDHASRVAVHTALIAARRHIDRDRRRGDDWGRISRIDWDADGVVDVQVEQSRLSLVVDPSGGGELLVLDDKQAGWPVTVVDGEPPGVLCQHTIDAETVLRPDLELVRLEEGKGETTVDLAGPLAEGAVSCRVTVTGARLLLTYELEGLPSGRFGPQIPIAVGRSRLRVDGSDWLDVADPHATAGHRFRLGDEGRQLLLTSMVPAELFVRPAGAGLVAWPHWPTPGDGRYELSVEITG